LPFDASLFADIRKPVGAERFEEFRGIVIRHSESLKPKRKRILKGDESDDPGKPDRPDGQIDSSGD
jgi:hypothetical protein